MGLALLEMKSINPIQSKGLNLSSKSPCSTSVSSCFSTLRCLLSPSHIHEPFLHNPSPRLSPSHAPSLRVYSTALATCQHLPTYHHHNPHTRPLSPPPQVSTPPYPATQTNPSLPTSHKNVNAFRVIQHLSSQAIPPNLRYPIYLIKSYHSLRIP